MKIGVFSDSHDHMTNIKKVTQLFLKEKVAKIVHFGDFIAPFIKNSMMELKDTSIEVLGVFGNNDGERSGILKILGQIMDVKGDFHGRRILHHLGRQRQRSLVPGDE